ncbi:MAG: hypothetical protein IMX02_11955 [Limnochordaceae bacterium]|nr:hypothetical protein [Limnochordaceae bacterium]
MQSGAGARGAGGLIGQARPAARAGEAFSHKALTAGLGWAVQDRGGTLVAVVLAGMAVAAMAAGTAAAGGVLAGGTVALANRHLMRWAMLRWQEGGAGALWVVAASTARLALAGTVLWWASGRGLAFLLGTLGGLLADLVAHVVSMPYRTRRRRAGGEQSGS